MTNVLPFREAAGKARAEAREALARLRAGRAKAREAARPRWQPEAASPADPAPVQAEPPPGAPQPERPAAGPPRAKTRTLPRTGRARRIAEIVRQASLAPESDDPESANPDPAEPIPAEAEARAEEAARIEEALGEAQVSVDLSVLTILGPGLRWRLSQLGIDTLKSLSKADADWLRRELGEIGRLTHVEAWIEAAKAMDRAKRQG